MIKIINISIFVLITLVSCANGAQKSDVKNRLDAIKKPLEIVAVGETGDGGSTSIFFKTKGNENVIVAMDYRIESKRKGAVYIHSFKQQENLLTHKELETLKLYLKKWLVDNKGKDEFLEKNINYFLKRIKSHPVKN